MARTKSKRREPARAEEWPVETTLELLHRLAAIETDECVIWPRRLSAQGYAYVYGDGYHHRPAHRVALELREPPPTPRHMAIHGPCHNRACINYRHLRWGTGRDNEMDKVRDGTSNRGERHGLAKLTRTQAAMVRALAAGGFTHKAIAGVFGVSPSTVGAIARKENWAWL